MKCVCKYEFKQCISKLFVVAYSSDSLIKAMQPRISQDLGRLENSSVSKKAQMPDTAKHIMDPLASSHVFV